MKKKIVSSALAAVIFTGIFCGCSETNLNEPVLMHDSSDTESTQSGSSSSSSQSSAASSSKSSISQTSQPQTSAASSSIATLKDSSDQLPDTPDSHNSESDAIIIGAPEVSDSESSSSSSVSTPTISSTTSSTTSSTSTSSSVKPEPVESSSSSSESSSNTTPPVSGTGSLTHNESILNNYSVKWGYNTLSSAQKELYKIFVSCAENVSEKTNISHLNLSSDDVYSAYWAFDYDNPQYLELGCGYSYTSNSKNIIQDVMITYARSTSNISYSDFNSTVNYVISEANKLNSDYAKLKYIHDWIINRTVYKIGNTAYETEADGVFVYGRAVCEGYSKAFMYLAQSLGFECVCVIGTGGVYDHMWNLVKLEGNWYHVDVTWDDPIMADGSQVLRSNYFLISDSQILRNHVINSPFSVPSAPYNYQ